MISGSVDGKKGHGQWIHSPRVAMSWAILGCICSFFCPMFLFLKEGQAFSDPGPIRIMIMLLSCVAAAGIYRVGFVLRHHRFMYEKPAFLGLITGTLICCSIFITLSVTFVEEGTWPTVVGLEFLAVSVFVLLEMARPVFDFFILRFFVCLPMIAGGRRHGWDFVNFGWPMIVITLIFVFWREFSIEDRVRGPRY